MASISRVSSRYVEECRTLYASSVVLLVFLAIKASYGLNQESVLPILVRSELVHQPLDGAFFGLKQAFLEELGVQLCLHLVLAVQITHELLLRNYAQALVLIPSFAAIG